MKKKAQSLMGMAFFGPALVLLTVFLFQIGRAHV